MAVGIDPVQDRIRRHARMHLVVALNRAGLKPVFGKSYRFSDIEGKPEFVGEIYDDTQGSIRYGDILAVPDDRGVIHFAFLGPTSGKAHVAGIALPGVYSRSEMEEEMELMWLHTHRHLQTPQTYSMNHIRPTSTGPDLDVTPEEVAERVGKVDRWFHARMLGNDHVVSGDFAEFRMRDGASSGLRARIEATPNGYAALTGRRSGPEDDVREWRVLWCDRTISGCLDYLLGGRVDRLEMEGELVDAAAAANGVLRYTKGMLNGILPFEEGAYFIRNWVPCRMEYSRGYDLIVETLLDVRDILDL